MAVLSSFFFSRALLRNVREQRVLRGRRVGGTHRAVTNIEVLFLASASNIHLKGNGKGKNTNEQKFSSGTAVIKK